ncbi:hypothetical protein ACILE9_10320 [Capnocytophaga cynodegmi]|uniref:hypothetical protein n=1 Tax=Capnocytophaga cynodegmi TaxID=28189 RepID=UPI0037D0BA55
MEEQLYHLTFADRPISLYPSYRPMYKISLVLMILYYNGYGGKCSLLKMHLFSWALKSDKNLNALKEFVTSNFKKDIKFFGIELTLNRALNLAHAQKLIGVKGGNYFLLDKGQEFINAIIEDKELFVYEKQILSFIGKKITEKIMNELINRWNNA